MTKIFFVAVFTPDSTNVSQSRGFKQNDCEVYEYDYRQRLSELNNNVFNRDSDLITEVNKYKPDIVLFSKCDVMDYRVIDECNKVSKTILWYMDPLHNFNMELIEKIKRCNYVLCGLEGVVPYAKIHNENSSFLHQCPDDDMNFMLDEINHNYDVTFIGTRWDSEREKYKKSVNFLHLDNVFGLKHNKVVNESKINLNFSPDDATGASVRIYKIMLSGGFLMSTPWSNMRDTFIPGEDFIVFNDPEELKEKIEYYLNNDKERNIIRLNGYEKVQKYLPKNWAKSIIELIKK